MTRSTRASRWFWFAALYAFGTSAWVARGYLLDDAFIHLRYAEHAAAGEWFAFNTGEPSFGCSSIPWILLLAQLGRFVPHRHWPALAKGLSLVFNLCSLLVLARLTLRSTLAVHARTRTLFLFVVLALLAFPTSIRWLQDGMETSLAVLLAFLCVWRALAVEAQGEHPLTAIADAMLLALPGILRIDLAPLSLCAAALAANRGRRFVLVGSIVPILSFQLWVRIHQGSFLPDTAIAKASGAFSPSFPLWFAVATAGATPAWLAGPLAATAGAFHALRQRSWRSLIDWAALLAPLVLTLSMGALRGQAIQGPRYFLPALAFSLAGALLLCPALAEPALHKLHAALGLVWAAVLAQFLFTFASLPRLLAPTAIELPPALTRASARLAAFDIGLLGWSTEGVIEDWSGLVHGREVARAGSDARRCLLAARHGFPDALVLTAAQADQAGAEGGKLRLNCPAGAVRYRDSGRSAVVLQHFVKTVSWSLWLPEPG